LLGILNILIFPIKFLQSLYKDTEFISDISVNSSQAQIIFGK
jgi:hypothetical protein